MEFNPIAFNMENEDRHLIDYLPPFMQQVQEFQAINAASEPEIKAAWQSVSRVLNNQFLAEADAQGLAVWERELGIFAKDTDTLALRRARILAAWQRQPPYTMRWLRAWLDSICGADNYKANVQDYTLNIQLEHDRLNEPGSLLREITTFLNPVKPANILLNPAMLADPILFPNEEYFQPVSLLMPFYFSNQPNDINLLNGQRRLDGSWKLNSDFRGVVMCSVGLAFRFSNIQNDTALLNGRRLLDGSWYLEQTVHGFEMRRVSFGNLRFGNHECSAWPSMKLAVSVRNQNKSGARSLGLVSSFVERQTGAMAGGSLTRDTMWRLDGNFKLDGSKKLNAAIVTENL